MAEVRQREGLEGWELQLRPGARALTEVLSVVERVEDSKHLTDLVYIAQTCGLIEPVYLFTSLGPEPMAPVSGELEYDLVLLEAKGQIAHSARASIVLTSPPRPSMIIDNYSYVKSAEALQTLATFDPAQLAAMAKVAMLREIWIQDEIVLEKAARSLFMSEPRTTEFMSYLNECSA